MKIFHLDFRFLKLRSGKSLMRKFQPGVGGSLAESATVCGAQQAVLHWLLCWHHLFTVFPLEWIYIQHVCDENVGKHISPCDSLSLASFTNGIFRKQNKCRQCENVTWIHLKANKRGKHCDQSFIMSNVLHRANLATQISPPKTSVNRQNLCI